MSFRKFKIDSYCVGSRRRFATKNMYGDTTSKGSKIIVGKCSICNRKISMTAGDDTIQVRSLGDLFKNLCKKGPNVSRRMEKFFRDNGTSFGYYSKHCYHRRK